MVIIAIEWIWNCWKSTIINWSKDWSVKPIQERFPGMKFKFYGETARDVMNDFDNIQNRDMQSFQDIIYHLEVVRIHQLREDIRQQLYDVIFVDRTTLWNQIFAIENQRLGKLKNLNPLVCDPTIYDHIIYMNQPIWSYSEKHAAFNHYETEQFINTFTKYIEFCFDKDVVHTFKNYLDDQSEVDILIEKIMNEQNLLKCEK